MQRDGFDDQGPLFIAPRQDPANLQQAIAKLKSLYDGDRGLIEIAAYGQQAVPALRALLFERDPSGLFQARYRALQALVSLKAYDVVAEFLGAPREAPDPVERIGDEMVASQAARAMGGLQAPYVFDLLQWLAGTNLSPGVVTALGASGRIEAIPYLVEALAMDECRLATETSLRHLGAQAHQALTVAACRRVVDEPESESRLRQRRSALGLLSEMGVAPELWSKSRDLMWDQDAKISVLACKICLKNASEPERCEAVLRLRSLLTTADFLLKQEIEQALSAHFGKSAEAQGGAGLDSSS